MELCCLFISFSECFEEAAEEKEENDAGNGKAPEIEKEGEGF